jgi:hypothetical protein
MSRGARAGQQAQVLGTFKNNLKAARGPEPLCARRGLLSSLRRVFGRNGLKDGIRWKVFETCVCRGENYTPHRGSIARPKMLRVQRFLETSDLCTRRAVECNTKMKPGFPYGELSPRHARCRPAAPHLFRLGSGDHRVMGWPRPR